MYIPYYHGKGGRPIRLPSKASETFEGAVRNFLASPELMKRVPGAGIIGDDDTNMPGYFRPRNVIEDADSWYWSADP